MPDNQNLELYTRVRSVPDEAKKTIKGGRTNGFTDINPMWRIKVLTEEFGPCGIGWYYKPVKKWIEQVGNEYAAFVDIELYVKINDEWSMPICGNGGSRLATSESKGIYVSDECYKMATTDALSVACKQLGIGADVYFADDKTKYDKLEVDRITSKQVDELRKEIARTGTKELNIIFTFSPQKLENFTVDQYEYAMEKLGEKADAPKPYKGPAQDIPDEVTKEAPFK